MAALTICSDFGTQESKVCHGFHFFPSIYHEKMRLDAMIFVFWMLSFKPAFSVSSFTFIKSLFSSSSLCAARVVSSAYLRLLIFLPAILIPGWVLSSLEFCMMYPRISWISGVRIYSLGVLLSQFWPSLVPCLFLLLLDLHTGFSRGR